MSKHLKKIDRNLLKTMKARSDLREQLSAADDKPIVAVLTPSHSGFKSETTAAFHKLVNASSKFAHVVPTPAVSSSVVHWVRNDLIVRLYKSQQPFDYVLFMDDDIVPPPDAVAKLLAHNKPIVAGACTVRQDPPLPNFRSYKPETFSYHTAFEWNGEGAIEVGAVGTGFMLISRAALETIADYYLRATHEQKYLGVSDEVVERLRAQRWAHLQTTGNAWWFEFLKHPLGDGEYGEDISFCFKARECGLPIFVDTTVRCGHVGNYAYSLDDFIPYREQLLAREQQEKTAVPSDPA